MSICIIANRIIKKDPLADNEKKSLVAALACFVFYLLSSHEFLASSIPYRLFWTEPFGFMFVFLILSLGFKSFSKNIRGLLYIVLSAIWLINYANAFTVAKEVKVPSKYLFNDRGEVFIGNPPPWKDTLVATLKFIDENIPADEAFFALPYDPIYYYFSRRKSPTRQLIFFEHINIPEQQQRSIISELEANRTNYILLSTRYKESSPSEAGIGTIGETHCLVLGKYIQNHFETVYKIGDFENPPGWATGHGIYIMKRKD
jgi:hypothetical protein